jgi:hypothetical protein
MWEGPFPFLSIRAADARFSSPVRTRVPWAPGVQGRSTPDVTGHSTGAMTATSEPPWNPRRSSASHRWFPDLGSGKRRSHESETDDPVTSKASPSPNRGTTY